MGSSARGPFGARTGISRPWLFGAVCAVLGGIAGAVATSFVQGRDAVPSPLCSTPTASSAILSPISSTTGSLPSSTVSSPPGATAGIAFPRNKCRTDVDVPCVIQVFRNALATGDTQLLRSLVDPDVGVVIVEFPGVEYRGRFGDAEDVSMPMAPVDPDVPLPKKGWARMDDCLADAKVLWGDRRVARMPVVVTSWFGTQLEFRGERLPWRVRNTKVALYYADNVNYVGAYFAETRPGRMAMVLYSVAEIPCSE